MRARLIRRWFASLALLALPCAAYATGDAKTDQPMTAVEKVDLAQYLGAWYEVAMIPNRFQAQCVGDTQARYSMDGEQLKVLNRCRKADGSVDETNGSAKIVPGTNNAKLKVTFFWPFYGNYWIVALDPQYRWVLVSEPSRKFGWVMSRTPTLDAATLRSVLDQAAAQGLNPADFKITPQPKPLG